MENIPFQISRTHLIPLLPAIRIWLVCLLMLTAASSCTLKTASVPAPPTPGIEDDVVSFIPELLDVVLDVPQLSSHAVAVSDEPILTMAEQSALYDQAVKRFFAPWHLRDASLSRKQAFWGVRAYGSRQGYAENLQPYPPERWVRVVALQNMDAYPSMASPAIVIRNTSLRILPSMRPFFFDPSQPGEGFPFDYFQNSALWLGTPLLVTHVSLDQAWFFVETSFVSGWVRREDVALAEGDFRRTYETLAMVAIRQDDTILSGAGGGFLGQTHIGAIFPLHSQDVQKLTIRVPARSAHGQAELHLAEVDLQQAAPMPLPCTSRNIASLADAMSGQLYGWGGMFENRDCSSTMRDLLLPFGIWLPRNSGLQARQAGGVISLENMDPEAKLSVIRDQGVPFGSLIWMPGHIGLYLGTDQRGEPLMLHNIWGARTVLPEGREGRAVIGRLAVTSLRPGEERPDVRKGAFLERVRGLTRIGRFRQ